jgi:hypothetical protein
VVGGIELASAAGTDLDAIEPTGVLAGYRI